MLELFPTSSLDNSILTSVWVGLMVVWWLHERLGWEFTGLVVPGYLASVFIIQPTTGLVIALEAVVTYLVVYLVSDRGPRWMPWFPLFGRDRFFLVLLASVAVRLVMEGGGVELIVQWTGASVSTDLHSMGLVVVPLAANALSRSGVGRGVPRIVVPLLVTWVLLDLVLLRYTNLSLSSFELTYEDLAVDFVSSPKAYILLLFGAWVGSRVNVRWGWDFGGIIVPGLLALCWLQPLRLFATVVEVFVIVALMRLLLRIRWISGANLTGARPTVLAFTTAFLVKYLLAWTLGSAWPGLRATDLFGFGYLLTTLIAIRALRYGDALRPVITSVSSSLIGFGLGTAAGYALSIFLPAPVEVEDAQGPGSISVVDALTAAQVDQGPVPDLGVALERSAAERLLLGGQGFGSAWIRPRGAPLVVAGVRGRAGMGLAVLGVGQALDARVILLCNRPGPVCDEAVADASRELPLMQVRPGAETLLIGEGGDLARLDMSALRAALGDFRLSGTPGALELQLAPAQRVAAADHSIGQPPGPLDADTTWGLLGRLDDNPFQPPTVQVFDVAVLQPMLDWLERVPYDEASLRVATGVAAELGLRLRADSERAVLRGVDLRIVLDRAGDGPVVHVPFTRVEPHAVDLAHVLAASMHARVIIEDSPPDLRPERYDRARAAHVAVLRSVGRLGEQTATVGVRGIRDVFDAGSEVVLASGKSLDQAEALPPTAAAVRELLDRQDLDHGHYDGASRRLSFLDPFNPARVAVHAGTEERDHVTLWATTQVRARYRPIAGDHPLAPGVELLPRQEGRPLTDLSDHLVEEAPDARWEPVAEALDAFCASGNSGWLQTAAGRAAARGAPMHLWCEPWLGCRWAVAERCGTEGCDGVIFALSGRAEASAVEPDPAGAREALLTGTGDVRFVGAPPVEEAP